MFLKEKRKSTINIKRLTKDLGESLQIKLKRRYEKYNYVSLFYHNLVLISSYSIDQEPGAPKRSPSAFFLFVNHRRLDLKMKYPDMPHTEVVKTLGKIWTQLPESEKTPFREKELHLRELYKIEAENWKKEVKIRQQGEKEREKEQKLLLKEAKKNSTKRPAIAKSVEIPGYINPGSYATSSGELQRYRLVH